METNKVFHKKEWTKTYRENGSTFRISARGQLYHIQGNNSPYFSLTADINQKAGNGRWVEDSGGCLHEEILRHWPHLKPLVDIHLSDDKGIPMHAAENAWYWAGGNSEWCKGGKNDPPNVGYLANHLRISLEDAKKMVFRVKVRTMHKQDMIQFVEEQRGRWEQEAGQAIGLLDN